MPEKFLRDEPRRPIRAESTRYNRAPKQPRCGRVVGGKSNESYDDASQRKGNDDWQPRREAVTPLKNLQAERKYEGHKTISDCRQNGQPKEYREKHWTTGIVIDEQTHQRNNCRHRNEDYSTDGCGHRMRKEKWNIPVSHLGFTT